MFCLVLKGRGGKLKQAIERSFHPVVSPPPPSSYLDFEVSDLIVDGRKGTGEKKKILLFVDISLLLTEIFLPNV